ncbi:MAG TPA: carboxylesterase family protein [Myxococcota bacterium]
MRGGTVRPPRSAALEAVAETAAGRVRGREDGDVLAFYGVPFAAPLTGVARFLPPEPPVAWSGVRDATRFGPAAPQISLPVFSFINAAGRSAGDECLTLNVWTPACDGGRRPVLVWIHGGAFLVGSGATPVYNGAQLAARGDVVVVTLNYRLGALGFAQLGLARRGALRESTNLGLRDQIAALEWVRDHIARFGGDPGCVTVFGQSAGGMSVGALLGAPRARALFRRAICQSGACDHVISREAGSSLGASFLAALGDPPLEALAQLPLEAVLRAQREVMAQRASFRDVMTFLPAVDGDLIPEQPLAALRRGAARKHDLMTGVTSDEWKLFGVADPGLGRFEQEDLEARLREVLPDLYSEAPGPKRAARELRDALAERGGDTDARALWQGFQSARTFVRPAARFAEAQHAAGGRVRTYVVNWRAAAAPRALGACHAIELPFVFGTGRHPLARGLTGIGFAAPRLTRQIQNAWIQFARTGDPSHQGLPSWPGYEPRHRPTMVLGARCELAEAPLDPDRQLLARWSGEAV